MLLASWIASKLALLQNVDVFGLAAGPGLAEVLPAGA